VVWEAEAVQTPVRPLRSDARRNREAMIAAARRVFDEHGMDAPLDLIARAAGVGRATQHRHFPTRESLLQAIFEENLDQLEAVAREAEPEAAFVALLRATVDIMFRDRGFMEMMDRRVPVEAQEAMGRRYIKLMTGPLRRAQKAGVVRADLKAADILLLVDMLYGVAQPVGRDRERYRMSRALAIVLEQVRPAG
jgi:AcrR family transcriptional regulator